MRLALWPVARLPSGVNVHPSQSEFLSLAQRGNLIPVYTDLMADFETPVSVYAKLKASGPAFLLESIEGGNTLNRYSFIGCQPRQTIECRLGGETTITERDGRVRRFPTPDPARSPAPSPLSAGSDCAPTASTSSTRGPS